MADPNQQPGSGPGGQNPYQDTTFLNHPGYRPYQDPNAQDVDLDKYPEAKDSTNKIRGRSELLETIVGGLEPELVVAKVINLKIKILINFVLNLSPNFPHRDSISSSTPHSEASSR